MTDPENYPLPNNAPLSVPNASSRRQLTEAQPVTAKADRPREEEELKRKMSLAQAHRALATAIQNNAREDVIAWTARIRELEKGGSLKDLLNEVRYRGQDSKHLEPKPLLWIHDVAVGSEGNLVVLSALPKDGKTAALNGLVAAVLGAGADCDTLGWRSNNRGKAVIHFDTEQSRAHHAQFCQRVCRRLAFNQLPENFRSYALAGFSAEQIRESIELVCEEAIEEFGGIHTVIVDGVGDAVVDVNDSRECMPLVTHLHALAMRFNCVIVLVLHRNPSSESKTRGHLGSQLERKAESNLTIHRNDDGISVLYGSRMRNAPLPKSEGVSFAWSDEAKMHVTVPNKEVFVPGGAAEGFASLVAVLKSVSSPLTTKQIVNALKQRGENASTSAVNRRLAAAIAAGNVVEIPGVYPRQVTVKAA